MRHGHLRYLPALRPSTGSFRVRALQRCWGRIVVRYELRSERTKCVSKAEASSGQYRGIRKSLSEDALSSALIEMPRCSRTPVRTQRETLNCSRSTLLGGEGATVSSPSLVWCRLWPTGRSLRGKAFLEALPRSIRR
jgi:hypothetical protein